MEIAHWSGVTEGSESISGATVIIQLLLLSSTTLVTE
jgi:hypothetical protein